MDAPFLLSMFCEFVKSREGVLFFIRKIVGSMYIALCVVYILCPFDIIPDVIPLIGYFDDMVAMTFIILQLTVIYFNYIRNQIQGG